MKKNKKTKPIDSDQAAAMIAILLEKLNVIKIQLHRRDWLNIDPVPSNAIIHAMSGSLYYTVEKR